MMMKTIVHSLTAILMLTVTGLAWAAPSATPVPDPGSLAFDTYSGYFVSNQFEPDAAESFLVITGQDRFEQIFGVAFVMGDKSHRLPQDAFKSNIVATVIKRGRDVVEYTVESVAVEDGTVELRYTATSRKSDTASFACPLIVSIPRGAYQAVQFVESGKPLKKVQVEKPEPEAKAPSPAGKAEVQQREVFYSGRVQGVGFRQTTSTLARRFTVSGFVKNLPDGRVQLVVEGQPKEIESFLTAIRKEMDKNITKTEETTKPATGKFQGFGIRY
jgi:acylphosphatase